jgi:hypothetical protein
MAITPSYFWMFENIIKETIACHFRGLKEKRYKYTFNFMDFHGFMVVWIFMNFYGFLWIFMDFYEFLWIFMDFYEFLWILLF